MGGLTASIRLAQLGYTITVFEARSSAGGLASSFEVGGLRFDARPYVLLDRPGLDWAFERLGLDLRSEIPLVRIEEIYDVRFENGQKVQIYGDRHRSAEAMEKSWPGSAKRYLGFVGELESVHRSVQPLQYVATPGWRSLVRTGAVRHAPFLLRGLRSALRRSGLASEIVDALSIWTHIAGQSLDEAPSLLALVPALIHTVGAFYPRGGIGVIPSRLAQEAETLGVTFRFDTKVGKLRFEPRPAVVVDGELLEFDAIVSNAGGVGTYLELCDPTPSGAERLRELPLQSPGRCTYLTMASPEAPYLRFYSWLPAVGGTLIGSFRLADDGEPVFYEFMAITEDAGSLTFRVKHFNPDMTGWEEKDETMDFLLVEVGENEAYFDGLTLRRTGSKLEVFLSMKGKDGTVREEAFVFERVP